MKKISALLFALSLSFSFAAPAQAELSVLTTTSDLEAIAAEIGGKDARVESLAKGSQDPHFLETKPSYMVKASKVDLLIAIGLGLEQGWLPSIQRGARNPKIQPGQKGFLEVGRSIEALEVPSGKPSRAEGDVHPEGNPHILLDPIRAGEVAVLIGRRLGELDPSHEKDYATRAEALQKRLADQTKVWTTRIQKSGVSKVISFHKTLSYFFDRFRLGNPAILEPLPGVPPTAKHILEVIERAKSEKVPLIMVENFFDSSVAKRVAKDVPGLRVVSVPVSVGGESDVRTIDGLYEKLVRVIEGKDGHG